MNVFEAISARRSVRRYVRGARIPEEHLRRIMEAARLAPSAKNSQPWRFVVVKDEQVKRRLVKACRGQRFLEDASVVIAALGVPSESRWYMQDPMIAVEHMVLEATELGYGTCWIGAFEEDEVKEVLSVPEEVRVVCLLALGVPAESPPPRPRKSLGEIFYLDRYGAPYPLS